MEGYALDTWEKSELLATYSDNLRIQAELDQALHSPKALYDFLEKLLTADLGMLFDISSAFLFYERLRERIGPPMIALSLVVLIDAISCAYAISGKFALYESLKVVARVPLSVPAPVVPGQVVGEVCAYLEDQEVAQVDLVATAPSAKKERVPAPSSWWDKAF